MKQYIIFGFFLLLSVTGCKKDELMSFDTSDSIYFHPASSGGGVDSSGLTFFFAAQTVKDSVMKIRVNCTCAPKDYDRHVRLIAGDSSTAVAGEHYQALPDYFVFRAGRVSDTISIKLLRSASLKDQSVLLDLNLVPNEHFSTNLWQRITGVGKVLNYTRYKLTITDLFGQPPGWDAGYFGVFSLKKLNLILSLLNLQIDDFATMTTADKGYYGGFVKRYLVDMDLNGNTVYEDDGTMMAMGTLAK